MSPPETFKALQSVNYEHGLINLLSFMDINCLYDFTFSHVVMEKKNRHFVLQPGAARHHPQLSLRFPPKLGAGRWFFPPK
jgi:hypothetical protein